MTHGHGPIKDAAFSVKPASFTAVFSVEFTP